MTRYQERGTSLSSVASRSIARRQLGFTLIELMIALTLGLLVTAVLFQVYLGQKSSSSFHRAIGDLGDRGRFAMDLLKRDIRMAGFPMLTGPVAIVREGSKDCSVKAQKATMNCDVAGGDTLTIQYVADVDCLGQDVTLLGFARNHYYVQNQELRCLGNGDVLPQVISEGVLDFQLLFGEDTDDDGSANRYLNADQLAVDVWDEIVSVQVALLVVESGTSRDEDDTAVYRLLDGPALGPYNDRRLRRIFHSTVAVRNRVPNNPFF